ncbi:MAG TPA: glycyl-radical enzyme activating protein [Erysipelotrichaceae bacterium]|nr:glycyl-radical enzyme activating protein [Erysipelotrichaceae bacterium]
MKGRVTNIQRYSLHDGPGIRTTVFFAGCGLRCLWCSNPESLRNEERIMVFTSRCTGCAACLSIDTDQALTLNGKSLTFDPQKDLAKFIAVCPYKVFVKVNEEVEAEDVANTCLRDRLFYEESRGGVTFSGGEPLLQPEFLKEVVQRLKKEGIHIAIETAGNVGFESFEVIDPYVDLYLYDLKFIDPVQHLRYTGQNNEIILSNLERLIQLKKNIVLRMVLLNGINDTDQEWDKRFDWLKHHSSSFQRIELLAYHNFGEGKYVALGEEYPMKDQKKTDEIRIQEIKGKLESMGFEVHVENAF